MAPPAASLILPDTAALRKARGAFFTPPAVAQYVCQWAIRSCDDQVYEPSCGEADFLLAAGARLRQLGATQVDEQLLRGAELHQASADEALKDLSAEGMSAGISVSDFFDVPLDSGSFDAVVGNPPYARYQAFQGESRRKAQEAALMAGVRLSGLASSWAAFTVRSAQLVKPGGRLGLVLPAELLSTNYAGPVRRFLMDTFRSVRLIMFDERIFPGVLAEVVLLLAEGNGSTDCIEISQARNLHDLAAPPINRWRPSTPEAKWTPALLQTEVADLYSRLVRESFTRLDTWGRTDLGMVTGNNRYFCLTATQVNRLGLTESELEPISPPGSRHLRGLTFSQRAWRELAEVDDRPVYLFRPRNDLEQSLSPSAAAYIADGERTDVNAAYKCRVRTPWWRVPQLATPDLFLTYMNHDTPRLVTNEARVGYLNSVHGVTLLPEHRRLGRDLLPLGVLNALTLLGAELVGRSYGGGILKVEPKEADMLPVPSPAVLESAAAPLRALRPQLAKYLRGGRLPEAVALVDRVLLVEHIGLKRADVAMLREAQSVLFARRVSRGGTP